MKTLRVGIAGYGEMKARSLAIARGEHRPGPGEPKVWFPSLESFAKVLSDSNRALLRMITEDTPGSIAELSERSGRARSNLSRTLHTMERYGLLRLEKGGRGRVVPRVPYSEILLDVPIKALGEKDRDARVSA